jgi:flagellar biosynthesis/type III secretory pathway chaperone
MDVLKSLEDALADETRLERELLGAGSRKRDALVALDLRAVDQATSREQNLLVAVAGAAERRLRRTADAAKLLGIPEGEASVTRVARRAGEPWAARLSAAAEGLRQVLRELASVNRTNRALTEQSIARIRDFFAALSGSDREVVYTRRGLGSGLGAPRILIDEVI